MTAVTDKKWALYLAMSRAKARLVRGVRTQFEDANMQPWLTRLYACRTVSAVDKLMAAFEAEDAKEAI